MVQNLYKYKRGTEMGGSIRAIETVGRNKKKVRLKML